MRSKWILVIVLLLGLATAANAGVEHMAGYVDFAKFGLGANQEPTVEVNLTGPMLKLAAMASNNDDENLGEMLSGLAGIYVRTYEMDDTSPAGFEKAISSISQHLQQTGWETIVKVRERDERAHIAIKMDGENIVGMTVLAMDENDKENEVVFVNIVGLIDLARIGRMGRHFDIDIDALDSLDRDAIKKDTSKKR